MKKKVYWYRMHYGECPVCGRDASYRECVYGIRPDRREDRVIPMSYQEAYCGCDR